MKKSTRKGSIFPAAGCRFVVNCSLLGIQPPRIEMNSPFTFTPTTTSTTYTSRRGGVNAENNSVHTKDLPFRVGDFLLLPFFLPFLLLKNKNSERLIWQILAKLATFAHIRRADEYDGSRFEKVTLRINLLAIKISSLELSFLNWHHCATFCRSTMHPPWQDSGLGPPEPEAKLDFTARMIIHL